MTQKRKLLNLFFDSYVFSCPQLEEGREAFEDYINNIISWQALKGENCFTLYISTKTVEILFDTNSYPLNDSLKKAISHFGIKNVQARDIIAVVDGLLKKLPVIEDRLEIYEILVKNFKCEPDHFLDGRIPEFIEHYQYVTTLICLLCHLENIKEIDQVLITRNLNGANSSLNVLSEICDWEVTKESLTKFQLPLFLKYCFPACIDYHGLRLSLNPITIWKNAESEECCRKAIEYYIDQTYDSKPDENLSWLFGNQFLQTAKQHKFFSEDDKIIRLFRAISETILKENLAATHWLRMGKGGNEPQKQRQHDGASAWRRDIDRDFHLHYWKLSNEIEFASIAFPHDDMSIPE